MPSKQYFHEYYMKNRERILKRVTAYNESIKKNETL
jgi:hypothetical protein